MSNQNKDPLEIVEMLEQYKCLQTRTFTLSAGRTERVPYGENVARMRRPGENTNGNTSTSNTDLGGLDKQVPGTQPDGGDCS